MGQVKDVIKDPESYAEGIRDGAEASMARSYEQGRVKYKVRPGKQAGADSQGCIG